MPLLMCWNSSSVFHVSSLKPASLRNCELEILHSSINSLELGITLFSFQLSVGSRARMEVSANVQMLAPARTAGWGVSVKSVSLSQNVPLHPILCRDTAGLWEVLGMPSLSHRVGRLKSLLQTRVCRATLRDH